MISKRFFVRMNSDTPDSELQQGDIREAWNTITGITQSGQRSNLKGTTQIAVTLPTGTNACVGAKYDPEKNVCYFFNKNSNGNHGIYKYNPSTGAVTTVLQWSGLAFTSYINGIEIVKDLLYWINGEMFCLNTERSYSPPYYDHMFTVVKTPPVKPVTVTSRLIDSSVTTNFISNKNFQFAYRYCYKDDEYSLLSPYSVMSYAEIYEAFDNSVANYIRLTVDVESDVHPAIKSVDVLVRENNDGQWYIFKTVDSFSAGSNTVDFYNSEPKIAYTENKYFEPVSRESDNMAFIENRIMATQDLIDFDIDDSTYDLTLTLSTSQMGSFYKDRDSFKFGIVFFDKKGRNIGVRKVKEISLPAMNVVTNQTYLFGGQRVVVTITGTPPIWAYSYAIVRTRGQRYALWATYNVVPLFYVADYSGSGNSAVGTMVHNGCMYLDDLPSNHTGYLHLQMPVNAPFIPDGNNEYYVRLLADLGQTYSVQKVLDVRGDAMVVKNFGITNWSTFTPNNDFPFLVEVFVENKTKQETFYEIGRVFKINNPGTAIRSFSTTSITLNGDVSSMVAFKHVYNEVIGLDGAGGQSAPDYLASNSRFLEYSALVPTPARHLVNNSTFTSEANTTVADTPFAGELVIIKSVVTTDLYTFDYKNIADDKGRAFTEIKNVQERSYGNQISFSDPYIQDTKINGLSSYEAANKYTLSLESGKINKLIAAGDVLLAVHSNTITSLYIGEGFLRTGEQQLLMKTEGVMDSSGERKLIGFVGTQHPESVVSGKNHRVYGFDFDKAEPWRRSYDGIVPLATQYGFKKWFKEKCDSLSSTVNIIGGYHPYYDMYIITFPDCSIGFSELTQSWVSLFNWTPEMYASIGNNKMIGFKNGIPYLHDSSSTYNNFYGTQYTSSIKFVENAEYSKEKLWKTFSQEGTALWYAYSIKTPSGQETDLLSGTSTTIGGKATIGDFIKRGNVYYANILRDKNTDTTKLNGKPAIRFGDEMRGRSLEVTLKNASTDLAILDFVNIGFDFEPGHVTV